MWRVMIAILWLLQRTGLADRRSVWLLPEATRKLLLKVDSVEVFSLGGVSTDDAGPFPGAVSLGSVVVESKRVRKRLLRRILLSNKYNIGGLLCLGAEYGVRVTAGEITLDFMFCFDCSKVWVSGPEGYRGIGTIAPFPVPLLNRLLTEAGIALPPPTEH